VAKARVRAEVQQTRCRVCAKPFNPEKRPCGCYRDICSAYCQSRWANRTRGLVPKERQQDLRKDSLTPEQADVLIFVK
jgi:hypothetical protein